MVFNVRLASFISAAIVTVAVFIILLIVSASGFHIFISCIVSFSFTYGLFFFLLKRYVFDEIDKVYTLLMAIKKGNYQLSKSEIIRTSDPLRKITMEISDFAQRKEKEIEELKKLETFRREFLADVSHELKTPIFSAQGFVHTLIDGAVDDVEVRDRFLQKAAKNLDGLNVLVEDLISISQMEIGEIKMQLQSFDLLRLTEDIFEELEETAAKKEVKLRMNKYNPRSCYVFADKYRIGQVLSNLVINAVKYGREKGNVVVTFGFENDYVKVSVQDDGPGIESKHLPRIFERFYRVDKSRSRDKGGTGLGLAIVKHILEAHGSKITVNSKVGKGTEFTFRLARGKVINEKG